MKKILLYIIVLIGLCGVIFSIVKLCNWAHDNKEIKKIEDVINNKVIIEDDENTNIDFEELKRINSDVVGYLKVNNTNISYPVVKTDNNEYYTNHNFYKKNNQAGWVFANYLNNFDGNDKNISIFAHNRLDGSMFGTLNKTLKRSWQENEDNLIIEFITKDEVLKYRVFSTYKIETENYYIKSNFNDEEEFYWFIEKIKNRSNYEYNIPVDIDDKILTLSTCDINNDYRIVLHAKRINK